MLFCKPRQILSSFERITSYGNQEGLEKSLFQGYFLIFIQTSPKMLTRERKQESVYWMIYEVHFGVVSSRTYVKENGMTTLLVV